MPEQTPRGESSYTASTRVQIGLLLLLAVIAYLPALGSLPLLDEQFLLAWLKQMPWSDLANFLASNGLDRADTWGPFVPVWLFAGSKLTGGYILACRLSGIILHCACTLSVYFLFRQLNSAATSPFLVAVLFAVYPLHPEAVFWLGGQGYVLASLSALSFAGCYLRSWAKNSVGYFTLSLLFLVFALLSSWTTAVTAAVIVLWAALIYKQQVRSRDGMVKILLPLILAGTFLLPQYAHFLSGTWSNIWPLLKNMILPVNQAIWKGYSKQYLLLYILLAVPAIALVISLGKNASKRQLTAWLVLWLLLVICPVLQYAPAGTDLYGSRLLYLASVPLCGLLSCAITSVSDLIPGHKLSKSALAILSAGLCLLFFFHTKNQNDAYRVSAKLLSHIQESVRTVSAKENAPVVLVRDVPEIVSLIKPSSPERICVFDGSTGLLRSDTVSGGKFKDTLVTGALRKCTMQWEKTLATLLPAVLIPEVDSFGSIDASTLAQKLQPGLAAYKNICYDNQTQELLADSNSSSGPIIRFNAQGLSPIDTNFLYVDAQIDTAQALTDPQIELYWITGIYQDYSQSQRRVAVPATCNDKQFHRYFLPLRNLGWITGGPALTMTLGFPPGSRVRIKTVGTDKGQFLIPKLNLSISNAPIGNRFFSPFYNFPNSPELGLCTLSGGDSFITLDYDVSPIQTADACRLNIRDSRQNLTRTIVVGATQGQLQLRRADFTKPGMYYLQVEALNSAQQPVGAASDKIVCLVERI